MSKLVNKFKKRAVILASLMLVLQPLLGLAVLPAKTFAISDDVSSVVVNELLPNPAGDETLADEWIELYNNSAVAVPLTGWTLSDAAAETPYALSGSIAPGGYLVFSGSVLGFQLNNTTETVTLKNGETTVNTVSYTVSIEGSSYARKPNGTGAFEWDATPSFGQANSMILTEVAPVSTPTNDTTPGYTFNVTEAGEITYDGDCTSAITEAATGDNAITFNALAEGPHDNCTVTVTNADEESATLSVSPFTVDLTGPAFTWTVNPSVAGPAAPVKIKIDIVNDEPLTLLTGPPPSTQIGGKEAHIINDDMCTSYDILLTIKDPTNPYFVCLNKDENGEYTHTYDIGSYVGPEKVVPFSMTAKDALGNQATDETGIFKASNVALSPVVETPVVTPAVAIVTVTEPTVQNDQYGWDGSQAGATQGEVKADTTSEDQNSQGNSDDQEDVKGKKNVPLWGIIFLLILAGIGGYLFYSQSPEKATGKK